MKATMVQRNFTYSLVEVVTVVVVEELCLHR